MPVHHPQTSCFSKSRVESKHVSLADAAQIMLMSNQDSEMLHRSLVKYVSDGNIHLLTLHMTHCFLR